MSVKIFFCYAHEDEVLLNKLKTQLRPLQRQGFLDFWHDRDISAGTEWEREISKHLSDAEIILLLVSPDFMNSDYCYGIEMKRAIERHERGEVKVIPIILSYVHWQGEPLGKLQALPKDAIPITSASWHSVNEALFDVAEGIRQAIEFITSPYELVKLIAQKYEFKDILRSSAVNSECKNAMLLAQKEAERFQHNYIGTEHLLLGLISQSEGVATKVLHNLGLEPLKIKSAIEFIIGRGDRIVLGEIDLTPRAKKVIELTVNEACLLKQRYVGTEHLLLGLMREGEGIAAGVMESLGGNLEKLRKGVQNYLK